MCACLIGDIMEHALFYLRQLLALGCPVQSAVIKTAAKYDMNCDALANAAKADIVRLANKKAGML
jgi:hypothetical protein